MAVLGQVRRSTGTRSTPPPAPQDATLQRSPGQQVMFFFAGLGFFGLSAQAGTPEDQLMIYRRKVCEVSRVDGPRVVPRRGFGLGGRCRNEHETNRGLFVRLVTFLWRVCCQR